MSGTRGQGARRRRAARRSRDPQVQQRAMRTLTNAGVTDTPVTAQAPEVDAEAEAGLQRITDAFAAQSMLVWDAEDGVMDLMCDLCEALNPGDSYRWWVVDVALTADRAILCDGDADEYWLAPFTIGDDREPVLSPHSDWTAVESVWVKDTDAYALRSAGRFATRMACANCDHAYTAHLGTAGPCTTGDCGCEGYTTATTSSPDATSALAYAYLDPSTATSSTDANAMFTLAFDQQVPLPDEHQPGARMPDGNPTPAAPAPTSGAEWSAILAPEGRLTSDGRAFAPGSITWRELPLTLMAMVETSEGGHVGAEVAGRIDRIWRDDAAGLIRASGVFDSGEYGQRIASLVADQTLRGVSVDLAIQRYDVGSRSDWFDDDGNWAPKDDAARDDRSIVDIVYSDEPDVAVVLEAEIGMTTVCPFPAFKEAKIEMGDSLIAHGGAAAVVLWTATLDAGWAVTSDALTAAVDADHGVYTPDAGVYTASAPLRPPAAWFHEPEDEHAGPLTITDDGHVYGWAALWASCHIGFPGRCQPPPESHTNYAYFHLGEVECDDGSREAVGTITLDTGHAANGLSRTDTVRHYDDTGTAVAYVHAVDGTHGIWISGTLRPDVPPEKVTLLRAAKLSGDWRRVDGNLEMVALLTVNVPGFPVPRHRAEYVNGEIESLVAAGIPLYEQDIPLEDLERFRALASAAEFAMLALADEEAA